MVHMVMAAQDIPRGSFHEAALAEMMGWARSFENGNMAMGS